jgi:hypothetical protein
LTASSKLTPSTTYTATIVGGSGGVEDSIGNLMASNFTWTFTTKAAARRHSSYMQDEVPAPVPTIPKVEEAPIFLPTPPKTQEKVLAPTPSTTETTTPKVCDAYITKYIKYGAKNDSSEVIKLQTFLKDIEGETKLSITGKYNLASFNAVKRFQAKYVKDVLSPWKTISPTGYVYKTTLAKINQIHCSL